MNEIISINPATLESLGKLPNTSPSKVKELVAKARAAQPAWAKLSVRERARRILSARRWLIDNAEDVARTITMDNGKPLAEAMCHEILPVVDLLKYIADQAHRVIREERACVGVMRLLCRRARVAQRPFGVVGVIAPWNYPFSIAAGQVAAALVAGNSVLLKPSSFAPIAGGMVGAMFDAAGLPDGVFTHTPGDAETGRALIEARVDKIAFTGSVGVGKDVMRLAASGPTPLLLELGGKDPMIVRCDADIDLASSGAVWGAFTNAGQACASVERCYVHESIFEEFAEMCVRKALALKVGNGLDPDVEIGPMTTPAQLEHVEEQLIDAKARGANILCGGERDRSRAGFFMPPTVLTGVNHSFPIMRDETFGPVLPIMPFSDDMQAVRLANDSAYGLAASIWTKDRSAAKWMGALLQAGVIMINDCVSAHAFAGAPWGGVKQSGFGRSHGRAGIMEFCSVACVHENASSRKAFWWYPYDMEFLNMTGRLLDKITAIPTIIKAMRRPRL